MSQNFVKRLIQSQEAELLLFEEDLRNQISFCDYNQEYIYKTLIERRWWDKNVSEYLQEKDKLKLLLLKHGYVSSRENAKVPGKYEKRSCKICPVPKQGKTTL